MKLLDWFRGKNANDETRVIVRDEKGIETSFSLGDAASYAEYIQGRKFGRAFTIEAERAMKVGAVFACGKILGEDVGGLPLFLYRYTDPKNVERAYDHPLYAVLHDLPNPEMSAIQFRESMTAQAAFNGIAYARIARNGEGAVVALWPLENVRREVDQFGRVIYKGYDSATRKTGEWQQGDIFALPGFTFKGYEPAKVMELASSTIGLSSTLEDYTKDFFANDHTPGVYLKHPKPLSADAVGRIKKAWEETVRSGGVAVGGEGMEVQTFGRKNTESQLIEARKNTVLEVCRWFRMPPHKLADLDRAHFSNIDSQQIDYLTGTLRPWLVRWEQAIYRSLLSPAERTEFFAEHSVEGYLRGNFQTQSEGFSKMLEKGVFSINEVRAFFNMNPIDGGERHFVQLNMGDVSEAASTIGNDGNTEGNTETQP